MMNNSPSLVYADSEGNIIDHPGLEAAGASAGRWRRPFRAEWIPLPEGSDLFLLPGRLPAGYDPKKRRHRALAHDPYDPSRSVQAVAAFMAPAHTMLYHAAYKTLENAPLLPLFAYTAVGWKDGGFWVTGVRVDPLQRQDARNFDPDRIRDNARRRMAAEPHNRLVQHLGKCALTYGCPAARNLFMNRWEAPLPSSPACNSRCLGCISLQDRHDLCATQDRIRFVPEPEEIGGVAVPHLKEAPGAVVSFGQGCEGEPVLQGDTLAESVRLMRRETSRGTVNLNTNASLPNAVRRMCEAGLDSMRVSVNSCRPEFYDAYYRPKGYSWEDVKKSMKIVKSEGRFVSVNYLVLPGFTDDPAEFDALCGLIEETGLDLIQWRNLNIDPEWYLRRIGHRPKAKPVGMRNLMTRLRERFPDLRYGYYNPCLDPCAGAE
jgi:pyruvate-formate lyase-activating enzyme